MGIYRFKLPDIGEGVVEAEITVWHVGVGDTVSEDDPIADAMTDKATIELTSPVDGVISKVACEEGDILAVGADLVVFTVEGGEDEPELDSEPESAPKVEAAQEPEVTPLSKAIAPKTAPAKAPAARKVRRASDKVLAAPAVRRRADKLGIDLASVPSEGERVSHDDLDAFLIAGQAAPRSETTSNAPSTPAKSKTDDTEPVDGETRIKVIGLRRVIAQRMQASKRHIPHFTYVEEIDVTDLENMRARMNERRQEGRPKLTVLPLLIRALSVTLHDWPQFNARYEDGSTELKGGYVARFRDLNLGLATQTDNGLIVPVIKSAQTLSVWSLATEIARLSEAARTNQLSTEDLSDATTTLTSLGPLGGIVTTPVINRPEVAIFGPNKIREKLVLDGGEVVARKVMNFSISCDHRVIDGYDAAAMIRDLKARIEDPQSIFLL